MITMTMKMTNHAKEERLDRLVYIAMNMGFGEVIATTIHDGKRHCITDTGVVMIKDAHEEVLITAYVTTMDRAIAVFRNELGHNRLPQKLYNAISKNMKAKHHIKQDYFVA